jgi:hypothetical protein
MKLLIMQFSLTSRHFISLLRKYSPQHPVPPLMSETKFYNHTEPQKKFMVLYILIFMILGSRREEKMLWTVR